MNSARKFMVHDELQKVSSLHGKLDVVCLQEVKFIDFEIDSMYQFIWP